MLVYYLTDSLGLKAALAGIVFLVAKVWDVFIDPLIGSWSDRSLRLHGTRQKQVLQRPFDFTLERAWRF